MLLLRKLSQLLLLAAVVAGLTSSAQAERRVALLVGINNYLNRGLDERPLAFAERDVEELAEELKKNGFEVKIVTGRAATKDAVNAAVQEVLTGLTARDVVFMGFAGHGAQMPFRDAKGETVVGPTGETMEDAFFCPSDARINDSTSLISLTGLLNELRNKGGINMVMVDACRDDPNPGRSASRSISGNELNGRLPANTSIVFSCAAGQQALESKDAGGGHGVFFYHVLEGLRGEAADKNDVVTWDDLVGYVRRNVDVKAKTYFPELARSMADRRELEMEYVRLQTPHELRNMVENPILVRAGGSNSRQPAAAGGIRVGRNETYQTINSAVDAARAGDTILVTAGVYHESVTISKNLTLVAEGRPGSVIIEKDDASCVVFTSNEGALRGFTINCRAPGDTYLYGVDVQAGRPVIEDCDITSTASSCIAVRGVDSEATIRRNRIHDSNKSGIFLYDASHASIQDNEIFNNKLAGVEIKDKAVGLVVNCKIYGGLEGGGVYAYDQGVGTVQRCDIYNNGKANIECQTRGNLTVSDCQLHDSKECGVFFYDEGLGTVTNCKVYGNGLSGFEVKTDSNPTIRNCQVYRGQGSGFYFHENGRGIVEGCEIYENAYSGIAITTGAAPTIRDCRVHDAINSGIHFYEAGMGLIDSCDVYANAKSAIEIREKSNPTIVRTRVHDGKASGFFIYDDAMPNIEECDVYRNAFGGLSVKSKGNPMVKRCRFYDGVQSGIFVYEEGLGIYENCQVYGNTLANVEVREKANPTFRNCKIYNGTENGFRFYESSTGNVIDCEIYGNGMAAVAIESGAYPAIRKCIVRDGKQGGFLISSNAYGTVEDCDIYANSLAGVEIKGGANPTIRRSRVRDGKQCGVYVYEGGKGTVEDCDVTGNTFVGFQIEDADTSLTIRNSRIVRNQQYGVWVRNQGRVDVTGSDVTGNVMGSFLNEEATLRQDRNQVDAQS